MCHTTSLVKSSLGAQGTLPLGYSSRPIDLVDILTDQQIIFDNNRQSHFNRIVLYMIQSLPPGHGISACGLTQLQAMHPYWLISQQTNRLQTIFDNN